MGTIPEEDEGKVLVGKAGIGSDALRSKIMANSTSIQVAPLPVFLVSLEEELTVLDKLLSVTCADLVVCSHPPRSGESGTKRSTLARSENAPSNLRQLTYNDRRYATVSALAASSVPALLMARGHQVSTVPEVPLVINSSVFEGAAIAKTSAALGLLKSVGASADIDKVKKSRKLRAGKGKLRGRRHRQRRGPLVVYDPEVDGKEIGRAFRNIAGVETSSVFALNLLQLAPGGHLGRFIIWTSAAFKALDLIYGSTTVPSELKKDFLLPSPSVTQADVGRLINSSELQAVIRAAVGQSRTKRAGVQKKNPLQNKQVLLRLNPYASGYSKEKIGTKGLDAGKPERAAKTPFAKVLKED
jgi:large subunit ribosomal protein L4e